MEPKGYNQNQPPQYSPPPPPQGPQPFNQPPQEPDPSSFQAPPASPAPVPDKTNGFAIAGIILAFLLPLFGLILSIIGLKKSKNYNGKGKSLSIAGIVISGVLLLLSLLILPALVITTISSVQKRAAEEKNSSTAQTGSLGLGEVYSEKSGAYTLKLPKDWQAEQNEGELNATAFPPESTGDFVSTAIIAVDKTSEGETLASIVASELDVIKSQGGTLKSEKTITVNDVKGHEIIGSQDDGNGGSYEVYSIILVKGDSAYRVAYATSPDKINEYLPVFKASVQTFTIK